MTDRIEIKGLGDAVRAAKAGIAEVRRATADMHDSSRALVSTLGELKKQIDAAHDDVKFEAATLGNSPPSEPKSEEPFRSEEK